MRHSATLIFWTFSLSAHFPAHDPPDSSYVTFCVLSASLSLAGTRGPNYTRVRVLLTVHVRLHPQAHEKCSCASIKPRPRHKFLISSKLRIPSLLQSLNRVAFTYSPRPNESAYCVTCTTGMPILLCRSCSAFIVHSQQKHLSVVLFTMTQITLPVEFPVARGVAIMYYVEFQHDLLFFHDDL